MFAANSPLQLFASIRPSTAAPFGAPFALSAIVGPSYDADPALSANGCELVFISNRGGDRDLYLATVDP
ncbi:MAG: WD40-like Beta Propeller Repeat [Deltaproteobacteria bacterium]|nr:WD40-like Beta Propeller Repeat [Deltaproteobacteria bacterium]